MTVYCLYGLIVYFSGNEKILWFNKWTSFQALTSTFVNRNNFAAYAGIGLNCLIAYSFWLFTTTSVSFSSKYKFFDFFNRHPTQVIALSLSFAIVFTALLLTGSRAGIFSVIIAITYLNFRLYFYSKNRPHDQEKVTSLNKILPVFLICLWAMFLLSGDLLVNRLNSGLVDKYRLETYSLIVHLIENVPLYGTGLGSFPEVFSQHRTVNLHVLLIRAHNDYLEILLTAGPFVGGIFIVLLLLFLFRLIFNKPPSSPMSPFSIATTSIMIQLALHSSVDFPLQMPAIAITMCGIIGANAVLWCKHPASK
ncbi:MAG: O-antigen ligase family protein [Oceanospirillaceae bacterium]|nr:O-antigen ligase family protein [Oceanospirillaceae bacterium]